MIVYQCTADDNHNKAPLIAGLTPAPGSSTSSLMSLRPSHAYGVTSKKQETWGVWGLWQNAECPRGPGKKGRSLFSLLRPCLAHDNTELKVIQPLVSKNAHGLPLHLRRTPVTCGSECSCSYSVLAYTEVQVINREFASTAEGGEMNPWGPASH